MHQLRAISLRQAYTSYVSWLICLDQLAVKVSTGKAALQAMAKELIESWPGPHLGLVMQSPSLKLLTIQPIFSLKIGIFRLGLRALTWSSPNPDEGWSSFSIIAQTNPSLFHYGERSTLRPAFGAVA